MQSQKYAKKSGNESQLKNSACDAWGKRQLFAAWLTKMDDTSIIGQPEVKCNALFAACGRY